MEYKFIKVDISEDLGVVEMNRKHELNALSMAMLKEIDHAFTTFLKEESMVRLVVLTGGDECFSAGLDLKEVPNLSGEDTARYFRGT